jgi:hypothetical protein
MAAPPFASIVLVVSRDHQGGAGKNIGDLAKLYHRSIRVLETVLLGHKFARFDITLQSAQLCGHSRNFAYFPFADISPNWFAIDAFAYVEVPSRTNHMPSHRVLLLFHCAALHRDVGALARYTRCCASNQVACSSPSYPET